jgi:hypothetical protein
MGLAAILGRGAAELVDLFGFHPKVSPAHASIVGLRDVDLTERPTCAIPASAPSPCATSTSAACAR